MRRLFALLSALLLTATLLPTAVVGATPYVIFYENNDFVSRGEINVINSPIKYYQGSNVADLRSVRYDIRGDIFDPIYCPRGVIALGDERLTWNDCISSYKISAMPCTVGIRLYRDINYGGTYLTYWGPLARQYGNLNSWNDVISSFKWVTRSSTQCPLSPA